MEVEITCWSTELQHQKDWFHHAGADGKGVACSDRRRSPTKSHLQADESRLLSMDDSREESINSKLLAKVEGSQRDVAILKRELGIITASDKYWSKKNQLS